jgi:NAD(P)-dependent dehydrogenase (short-subunit alcohol dehydrogenase family)
VQQVNVRGTWLAIKHAAPAMIESGGGSIVCTSSVAGSVGVAGLAAYSSSKHAINGLVHVAALEFAKLGVRVNAVAPAPIDNAMMASIEKQASPDDPSLARQGFSGLIAMGRYGTNEEVANMVAFLASDEAIYCTGSIYPVDGGFLAA